MSSTAPRWDGRERLEFDDFGNAVDEFGSEKSRRHALAVDPGWPRASRRPVWPRNRPPWLPPECTQIRSEDVNRVAAIDGIAGAVRDSAFVEGRQEHVEEIRVGLFDFVEEDDAEGALADGLGEEASLPAFLLVTAGGADQGPGLLLLLVSPMSTRVRASVVPKRNLASSFASWVFPTPDGPRTGTHADRTVRGLRPGQGSAHSPRQCSHRLFLADHAGSEGRLHIHGRRLSSAVSWPAGIPSIPRRLWPRRRRDRGAPADNRASARDVDRIDALVGLVAILDVLVGEAHRGLHGRRLDRQRLAHERRVWRRCGARPSPAPPGRLRRSALRWSPAKSVSRVRDPADELPVLVLGCSANARELAASQRRFEELGCVGHLHDRPRRRLCEPRR